MNKGKRIFNNIPQSSVIDRPRLNVSNQLCGLVVMPNVLVMYVDDPIALVNMFSYDTWYEVSITGLTWSFVSEDNTVTVYSTVDLIGVLLNNTTYVENHYVLMSEFTETLCVNLSSAANIEANMAQFLEWQHRTSQLNGNNGSWTNTDDVEQWCFNSGFVHCDLNGVNGEATNSDDVKRQRQHLVRKLRKLVQAIERNAPQTKIRQRVRQTRVKGQGAYTGTTNGAMYTGMGSYKKRARTAMRSIGRVAARVGKKALNAGVAELSKSVLSNVVAGSGAYEMTSNSLVPKTAFKEELQSMGAAEGRIRFGYTEFVSDILGSGPGFSSIKIPLNPALSQAFPWLSQIACNFERYKFVQLIFYYRTTTAPIGSSTTGQVGTIILVTNYNVLDAPFNNKVAAESYRGGVSGMTTADLIHGVECDVSMQLTNAFNTRNGPPNITNGAAGDNRLYDCGTTQVCQNNVPSSYNNLPLGELWVQYVVELWDVKLCTSIGLSVQTDTYYTPSTPGSTYTAGHPFGTSSAALLYSDYYSNLGSLLTPTSTGFIVTLPVDFSGGFTVALTVTVLNSGTGSVGVNTVTIGGNIFGCSNFQTSVTSGTPTWANIYAGIQPTASGQTYIWQGSFQATAATGGVNNTLTFAMIQGYTGGVSASLKLAQSYYYLTTNTQTPLLVNELTQQIVSANTI